ncbi:hypothetical protein ACDF64_02505 [Agromyces sp. MMS24-JH15]|uniref:hypothetical protein n=1 Tax=Agromyces sp. MMS24-JH15 TaxID=3243765 RepID=UPI00374A49F5
MKRTGSVLAVAALGLGLTVVGVAAPANAEETEPTPVVVDCEAGTLTVTLSGYSVVEGQDAVVIPAVEGTPEVVERVYIYKNLRGQTHVSHKNAGRVLIYDFKLWFRVGVSDVVVDEGTTPVDEQVITPAVEADATPNTVAVEIAGTPVVTDVFGETYEHVFKIADGTDFVVTVDAFDSEEPEVVAEGTLDCSIAGGDDEPTGSPLAGTGSTSGTASTGTKLASTGPETAPLIGGAAALLALGGIAFGASRRRARA